MGLGDRTNQVDVFRLHLDQHDQAIMTGNEVYQRLTGAMIPPVVWMRRSVMVPVLGRANYGSGEHVFAA
jgi:hypothetical protein